MPQVVFEREDEMADRPVLFAVRLSFGWLNMANVTHTIRERVFFVGGETLELDELASPGRPRRRGVSIVNDLNVSSSGNVPMTSSSHNRRSHNRRSVANRNRSRRSGNRRHIYNRAKRPVAQPEASRSPCRRHRR
jgi:hypothetical protein